ncbi:MAG: hypothetical protein RLZZ450_1541 [Pseudomonadota bacterium]|jgi:hypothetical protein
MKLVYVARGALLACAHLEDRMRSWSALVVVVAGVSAGFSLLSCSDEEPGPAVGPDTSWQIGCAEDDIGCGSSQNPHGPIGGRLEEEKGDDEPIKVTKCRYTSAGLQLELEQPEIKAEPTKKLAARGRSVVEITNALADDNKCFVKVTEYPLSKSPPRLALKDSCKGNVGLDVEGTCVLSGKKNDEGYAFNGEIKCDGMRVNGAGDPDYQLGAARDFTSPMKLQIIDCD